jgi:hypothetical protein
MPPSNAKLKLTVRPAEKATSALAPANGDKGKGKAVDQDGDATMGGDDEVLADDIRDEDMAEDDEEPIDETQDVEEDDDELVESDSQLEPPVSPSVTGVSEHAPL